MQSINQVRISSYAMNSSTIQRMVTVVVLALAFTSAAYGQQDKTDENLPGMRHDLTSNEENLIKLEAIALIEKYYSIDPSRYPQETHLIPHVILGRNIIVTSAEQSTERYKKRAERLKAEYPERDKSKFKAANVCVLSAGAAIVSGYFTVFAKDGSVMSIDGVAYILSKEPQGWRIAAFASTAPDRVVRCEREPLSLD